VNVNADAGGVSGVMRLEDADELLELLLDELAELTLLLELMLDEVELLLRLELTLERLLLELTLDKLEVLLRLELTLDTLLLALIMLDELEALTTLDMLLALLLEIELWLAAELALDAELMLELLLTPTPGVLLFAATSLPPEHPCNSNDATIELARQADRALRDAHFSTSGT